jgi:hypothetical protein
MFWTASNSYADIDQPCTYDIEQFCNDVPPVHGGIPKCLKKHEKELSPACKKRITKVAENMKKAHKVCADYIDIYCGTAHPGGRGIVNCLEEHSDQLSPACSQELGRMTRKIDK